jgi:ATP-binding cassette, subfamily B, bacterial PglK
LVYKLNIRNSTLSIFWGHISKRRQKQFYLLFVLMIFASLLEVVSIGAVLPFIGILTAPELIYQHPFMQPIIQGLGLTQSNQLILPLTIFFIAVAMLAGLVRLILLYVTMRLSFATGADLSINIYRRTLYQEYSIHLSRNSSQVIDSIITKTNTVIAGVINPILIFMSSIIIGVSIIFTLFFININIALITFIGFAVPYWLVFRYTKNTLKHNSQIIAKQSTQMVKALQEGLGGIRDVIIGNSQQFFCEIYSNADLPLRRASADNLFISGSPKFVMEAIGMILIACIASFEAQQDGGVMKIIPVLGALALGAQRLLPVLQQAYGSYSRIKGSKSSFDDVIDLLNQPLPKYVSQSSLKPIVFENKIELKKVNFRYTQNTPWIFKNISLTINKGNRVGFIGETGCGKSTLIDIIMGLLPNTSGELFVDQQLLNNQNYREWRAKIAHVPQNIYLSDDTIEKNIAFGVSNDQIDHQLVKKVAQKAQISEVIEKWEHGYQTVVGEKGIRISGGQLQRIGIARALYKQADVLIFDEATSALDIKTEKAVIKAIEGLGKELTILIVAHRLSTLKICDKIIELDKNNFLHVMSNDEIIKFNDKVR